MSRTLWKEGRFIAGNGFFGVYLVYILWIIGVEWINFFFSLAGISVSRIAEAAAFFPLLGLLFINKKHIQTEKIRISPELCIGILLIASYGFLLSVYPDGSFDTYNYHIIAQSPEFRNYFEGRYFGYGHFQVWGFRLGDRLFYYFRILFGFRMGTMLNTVVFLVAYMQLCQLLEKITGLYKTKLLVRVCLNPAVWAMVILCFTQSILMFGSYYVDVLAVPIGLEIFRLLLTSTDRKTDSFGILYFALLNGIWLGFKLTNIVYVVPCVILFVFSQWREFKAKDWFVSVIAGLYPFAVYLLYNFVCTGNPVFPYYNSIFKSAFYPFVNFKDSRWGGTTLFEKMFWICYAAFRPGYRQCEISDGFFPIVLITGITGMAVTCFYILFYKFWCRRDIQDSFLFLLLKITAVSTILWAFTTGYSRYFIFGRILWGIMAFYSVVKLAGRFPMCGRFAAYAVSAMAVFCLGCNVKEAFYNGMNWSWTAWRKETFQEELKYVFQDRTLKVDGEADADLFVLTNPISQGIVELLDCKSRVINASYASLAESPYEQALKVQSAMAGKMADIHSRRLDNIAEYITVLNDSGFVISEFETMDTYLGRYEIVSTVPDKNAVNTCWVFGGDSYELSAEGNTGGAVLSFIVGRYYDWEGAELATLTISASNGLDERELAVVPVDPVSIDKVSIPLELKADETRLILRAHQSDGEPVSAEQLNKVFVLNIGIE